MTNGPSINDNTIGAGVAGGAIAASLLETLLDKKILTIDEARGVLQRAMISLTPYLTTGGGFQAAQFIGAMQKGRFAARRD